MKTIIRVAITELRTLFYSPIAWFLIIVFLIQCGVVYVGHLDALARTQELGGMSLGYMSTLTQQVFLGQRGLFGSVMQNLYLYIPLLTMSLISRETSSGTIKLLYSSPVKVREIIFGKYLAMVVYSLLLVAVIAIFVVSGIFHIQYAETGMLMTALLGFFLLLCTYAAIGLFMSCLTTYQVVAAICTFVMIGILSYIGSLWQRVEFVRELTYFLSINGRTGKMLGGLVTTKDLIYFLVIVYIFLGLSIYKLKAGMESKPAMVKAGRYVAVVASALIIGYLSSLPGFIGYFDATANKTRTLTPQVQKILEGLGNEPLEVTAYVNLLDRYSYLGGPESYNQNIDRWEHYTRFKHNIKLNKVSYYDSAISNPYLLRSYPGKDIHEVARKYAKANDVDLKDYLRPEQIRKMIDLRPENNQYVMQLKWKNRTTWLRVFDDQQVWPGETEVAAALRRLQAAQMPVIAFVTGDLERDINKSGDRDYKKLTNETGFRNSLLNQGFDVQTVSLETEDIPEGIAALVLADPKIELLPASVEKLKKYIEKGGNLLLAGEPSKRSVLNPLLKEWNIQMMEGSLVQESKDDVPDMLSPLVTANTLPFYKPMAKVVADSGQVSMPGTAALTYSAGGLFTIQPLLITDSSKSWNRMKAIDNDLMLSASSNGPANTAQVMVTGNMGLSIAASEGPGRPRSRAAVGTVVFSPQEGDSKGPFATALSLTRKINNKEQRIVIAGDADFMSNKELGRWGKSNFLFSTALFRWLDNGEYPVDTFRPEAKDKRVTVTMDQVNILRIVYIWVLPAVLLIFASVLLIRRKRK